MYGNSVRSHSFLTTLLIDYMYNLRMCVPFSHSSSCLVFGEEGEGGNLLFACLGERSVVNEELSMVGMEGGRECLFSSSSSSLF